jgi:hypothetical protein
MLFLSNFRMDFPRALGYPYALSILKAVGPSTRNPPCA